jgi:peroxiredoxin Q/BCP
MPSSSTAVAVGDLVPDLTLKDDQGADVRLRDLTGRRVVLYFYPKDDTSGCTTQACAIRDSWSTFESDEDLLVYGVSKDGEASHQKFRSKFDLPFHLLVDEDHKLADAFGFWVEKMNYGKTYWGTERSTVIIDRDGRIQALKRKVQPAKHLEWLTTELGLG